MWQDTSFNNRKRYFIIWTCGRTHYLVTFENVCGRTRLSFLLVAPSPSPSSRFRDKGFVFNSFSLSCQLVSTSGAESITYLKVLFLIKYILLLLFIHFFVSEAMPSSRSCIFMCVCMYCKKNPQKSEPWYSYWRTLLCRGLLRRDIGERRVMWYVYNFKAPTHAVHLYSYLLKKILIYLAIILYTGVWRAPRGDHVHGSVLEALQYLLQGRPLLCMWTKPKLNLN